MVKSLRETDKKWLPKTRNMIYAELSIPPLVPGRMGINMTATSDMVSKFTSGLGSARYREIFETLESSGLCPLGKSNTETLLFQYRDGTGETLDVFAFRLGPPPVISFPRSYWLSRSSALNENLDNFSYAERPAITGPVSDSQYSAGQIELSRGTQERVVAVCNRVCAVLNQGA
jgi:hypothetical protein